MSAHMRAKVRVNQVRVMQGQEEVTFLPVTNGSPEDNTYSQYTPSGEIRLQITNPELAGQFKPGDAFYVDFTPVDVVTPQPVDAEGNLIPTPK